MRIQGALSLALLVLVAGCTSGGAASGPVTSTVVVTVAAPDSPAPSASGSASRPSSSPSSTPGPIIDATGHDFTTFVSPSGNIVCGGFKDGSGYAVRCDITQKNWTLPAKPADCQGDWGGTLTLGQKAQGGCVSDAMLSTEPLGTGSTWWSGQPGSIAVSVQGVKAVGLSYGSDIVFGDIVCSSATDGMHCTNRTTKAGFDVSRESYALR